MSSALHFIVLVSVGLLATSDGSQDDDCCKVCPLLWTQLGNRCFLFRFTPVTWDEGEAFCLGAGGNLASVRNDDEMMLVKELITLHSGKKLTTWIGGFDAVKEGMWQWADGTKFELKGWSKDQPNNYAGKEHCLVLFASGKDFLGDSMCPYKKSVVCSMDL